MTTTQPPTLTFNRDTGRYEGYLRVEVDGEIFRRLLLKAVEENTMADLTDPQTWATAVATVGQIRPWLEKPHVIVTPVASLPTRAVSEPTPVPIPQQVFIKKEVGALLIRPKTKKALLKEQMQEVVRQVPPYLWDEQCLIPLADIASTSQKQRSDINQRRAAEREALKELRAEWEAGTFVLDEEAEARERAYRGEQETKLTVTLDAVREAVNGSRIH